MRAPEGAQHSDTPTSCATCRCEGTGDESCEFATYVARVSSVAREVPIGSPSTAQGVQTDCTRLVTVRWWCISCIITVKSEIFVVGCVFFLRQRQRVRASCLCAADAGGLRDARARTRNPRGMVAAHEIARVVDAAKGIPYLLTLRAVASHHTSSTARCSPRPPISGAAGDYGGAAMVAPSPTGAGGEGRRGGSRQEKA